MRASTPALCLLVLSSFVAEPCAQTTGAIFTTDKNGNLVNGNLYAKKSDVYLSGGPGANAPCSAAGLPDGDYYFQVTDPSGKSLLTTDDVLNRKVTVQGGVIKSYSGTRKTGSGPCASKTVQLHPYLDTPNPGGEYKAWMTPVANYDLTGAGFFGFLAKYSKTDNYKIKQPGKPVDQCVIQGYKFYDANENHVWDSGLPSEVPIPGWRVEIYKAGLLDGVTFTDEAGRYTFLRDLDNSTYLVREVAPGAGFIPNPGAIWLAMTATEFTIQTNAATVRVPDFGNLGFKQAIGLGRTKGFWHNQNGRVLLEACDPDWRTALNGTPQNPICLRNNFSSDNPALSIFLVPMPPASFATAFDAWTNFIVGNPALGHGGFILSSQVAPAILNNTCGYLQGTLYVDRFGDGRLVSFQSMLAGAVGLLCDPRAGLTGPNDPYQDLRTQMLNCTNEFEAINNTGDPNNAQVAYLPDPSPPSFGSPYGSL